METKLVMWTCVAMAVMLSIVYFSLSFIASVVHQINERRRFVMDFLLWHAIAMISVIAVSFSAGYYTCLL